MSRDRRRIWLVTDLEPLPVDPGVRLMRAGMMSRRFASLGWDVDWFHSSFDWRTKKPAPFGADCVTLESGARLRLLPSCGYRSNRSLRRIRHQQQAAASFRSLAPTLSLPDVIVASYPYPELCLAAARFARAGKIPFIVDVRDPWPDLFPDYSPWYLRHSIRLLMAFYRRMFREILDSAAGITALNDSYLEWALQCSREDA